MNGYIYHDLVKIYTFKFMLLRFVSSVEFLSIFQDLTWFDCCYSVTVLGSRVLGQHLVWPSTLCLTRIQRTSWTKSPPNTWRNWPYSAPRSVNSLLDSVGSRPKLETAQARSLYDLDLKLVARQVDLVPKASVKPGNDQKRWLWPWPFVRVKPGQLGKGDCVNMSECKVKNIYDLDLYLG